MMSIRDMLDRVLSRLDLTRAEAAAAMSTIMDGGVPPAQIAAFFAGLRTKGEKTDEIAGCVDAMRARAVRVPGIEGGALSSTSLGSEPIDVCGTGGDGRATFNISTAAGLVAAGAGAKVAKHGNRALSSRCGSADVLEALGVTIEVPPALAARCLAEAGFCFLFAPSYHAAMRHAAPVRRELGVRTIMNILGPLANPARVRRQVVGVPALELTDTLARVFARLGHACALVVHGSDGTDEITTTGPTHGTLLKDGAFHALELDPEAAFGIARARPEALRGGDAAENAAIVRAVLAGEDRGPRRGIVLANAAAALLVAGIVDDLSDGVGRAEASIDSGAARRVLERVVSLTAAAAPPQHPQHPQQPQQQAAPA